MLQQETTRFLKNLKRNNNKSWFDEHRGQYETARADFYELVEELIAAIAAFDAPIGQLHVKDCIFRINRDIRFSKDKTPYKNNFACYFNHAGKKGTGAGYYFHIEPGNSMVAGGVWHPEPAVLNSIRQEIDYNFNAWKKICTDRIFRKHFPEGISSDTMLNRPPKGYDDQNPAIEFLKMKSFIVTKPVSDDELHNNKLIHGIAATCKTMKPFIDFLNMALH